MRRAGLLRRDRCPRRELVSSPSLGPLPAGRPADQADDPPRLRRLLFAASKKAKKSSDDEYDFDDGDDDLFGERPTSGLQWLDPR